jgi:conjugative transfer region protein TrbK
MDTKLFVRIGAVGFVAVAITMTALQLREEPIRVGPDVIEVTDPKSDPLPAQLRLCNAMGAAAAHDPICRAAWAEKRRRFLGKTRQAEPAPQPSGESSLVPRATAPDVAPQGEQ